ncbi:VOC family protein [Variovorax sp. NFACC27]|uniref:VOC family protein n=1 Tax=unclassified Variovorax TaxID=663243 RepID=UPI00089D817F|nr:catechol 2,3-dioxygenase [Variovorax paradoxus]SEF34678.1 Catechol-2,3-dioxygenase [Variovorax sp. NFACC28]SEG97679.1 Catechol-2,3-dioxygenase [Variovorax sp. NFACC29]SFD99533.1 Catechol-2,3-dioxygenase [Variovorax sp. NFACC26]SFH25215.1 Catechol-2,3-dioxygenase [Variovorax sp. NFACC27]
MSSPWIQGLRSVALEVPDLAQAEAFYTGTWRLEVAHRGDSVLYLRGTGGDGHLLALHQGTEVPRIRQVTLRARSREALDAVAARVVAAGGTLLAPPHELTRDPAGGVGLKFRDPHGRIFQVVHGDSRQPEGPAVKDRPIRLTHVVLNSHAVDETQVFLQQALGFRLADRTGIMAFMNCDRDHHTIAIGISDNDALNHIAFLMPDFESVMRGGGRMKDAGFPIQWGPGRHGPGNNLFNYFIDPFGVVIEYTAEVEQIDDGYEAHGPEHWKWPPGRVDQWGISAAPGAALKDAQRRIFFATNP